MELLMNKIAVLICNYNYGRFIEDAINSAVNQTRKSDLIIIVDDNSNDNSNEIIEKRLNIQQYPTLTNYGAIYQSNIGNLPVVFIRLNKTNGPSFARNVGIDITHSQIDLYQILDADDVMHQEKLRILEAKMMESQEIGVVYADYDILNIHTGNMIREYKEPYVKRRLLEECIVHSGSMIRKNALISSRDEFGYYDVNMRTCEDWDLWLRISEKFTIAHIPESLTIVRVHKDNSTYSVENEIWQQNWARIRTKLQTRSK
jgi:glycosyltransferase involved in cell wall biosynthesis